MRTILWFIYFWAYLLLVIPQMKKAQRLEREGDLPGRDKIVHQKVKNWTTSLLKLAGTQLTVQGLENIPDEPVIFVCNHQSYFDIPILLSHLDKPHCMIAKKEIDKLPLIRTWMRLLDCIFIDRDNPRQAVTALNRSSELLKKGYSVIIFPEGTRSQGDHIGEFKAGGFKVAQKAGVPIVPLAMDGSYRIMEHNHYWIKPAKVTLKILPPIETASLSRKEISALAPRVQEEIRKCKDD